MEADQGKRAPGRTNATAETAAAASAAEAAAAAAAAGRNTAEAAFAGDADS